MIKFIELFAGIGGFRYGLESCGKFRKRKRRVIGSTSVQSTRNKSSSSKRQSKYTKNYKCVYANEWDKYAATIYEKNFGERPDTRDITTVNVCDIPDHDLLTGGFPCQAFSIAGKRKGFEDTRGTLFFEIARILAAKKPRYLLLENVAGLLSHDRGRTFQVILTTLDELGYDLQWQVLNSKNFGVPQNRERVFIIGNSRGERRPEVFPIRAASQEFDTGVAEIANCLQSPGHACGNYKGMTMVEINKTVRSSGRGSLTKKHSWDLVISHSLAGFSGKGGNHGSMSRVTKNTEISKIRRLTPIECEKLQGFPDNWTAGISDTQRYKCLGNAVTTNVITEIGKRLINDI